MKNSCGAILYAYNNEGKLGIILGEEDRGQGDWLPFKGCNEEGESFQETASREIKEETCDLIDIPPDKISLEHKFSSKRKIYHIALCEVEYSFIEKFYKALTTENRREFKEKKNVKFFALDEVLKDPTVHSLSKASILYYLNRLNNLSHTPATVTERTRCHGISEQFASQILNNLDRRDIHPEQCYEPKLNSDKGDVHVEQIHEASLISDKSSTDTSLNSDKSSTETDSSKSSDSEVDKLVDDIKKINIGSKRPRSKKRSYRQNRYGFYPAASNLITRPQKISMCHTPNYERALDERRVWRREL